MKDFSNFFDRIAKEKILLCLPKNIVQENFWKSAGRGMLFELFQSSHSNNVHIDEFCKIVSMTVSQRIELVTKNVFTGNIKGQFLAFNPSITMYDGIAEEFTNGFFDSDDVPPPELWVEMDGEYLISFIPEDFLSIASEGVESCMSGCLQWISNLVEITTTLASCSAQH